MAVVILGATRQSCSGGNVHDNVTKVIESKMRDSRAHSLTENTTKAQMFYVFVIVLTRNSLYLTLTKSTRLHSKKQ